MKLDSPFSRSAERITEDMNSVDDLPAEITTALDRGATILTGNHRAARTLRRAFDLRNRQAGLKSWESPKIFAWDTWTTTLWRRLLVDGHTSRLLMNRTQEHSIWLDILAADTELRSLHSKDALAALAADAWRRLCSYRGQGRLRGAASSTDTMAFERWAIEFHRRCRDLNLLPLAELEDALSSAIQSGHLRPILTDITIQGFDRLTPAQTSLLDALRSDGCTLSELDHPLPAKRRLLVKAEDEEVEISIAARWARQFLMQHTEARIAIILPALEEHRAKIDSIFREETSPELQQIAAPESACPYEFSLGLPLDQARMVRAALDLLRLFDGPMSLERIGALLLSPYFAMQADERGARAEFDAFEVRRAARLRPEVSLGWLSTAAYKSPRRQQLGRLPSTLRAMHAAASSLNKSQRRTYAEWTQTIQELLKTSHWGAEHETSIEFQLRRKWQDTFDELASLDFGGSRVDFVSALASLERIAAQTIFAPASHDAPIQIMGAFEAAGSTFDAVWLMRAGDLSWPVPESTSPLLSWRLQCDLKMPGTDIARDSLHSRRITERVLSSSSTVIVSYSSETSEGPQRPSPALEGLDLDETTSAELVPTSPLRSPVSLDLLDDSEPIRSLPDGIIHGGANVLKHQAQCPFRAFAEHRLWSAEIEQPSLGMDAAERGIAVHRALELFWNEVKTQQRLKEMASDELASTLDHCTMRSLARMDSLRETSWDAAYMQMQRIRMNRLLMNWLELERQRDPFTVKASEETLSAVQVGPLRLNVRVDRLDMTDGGTILIDYKTGDVSPKAWLTERPDEPQLPLYAIVTNDTPLHGVAFGLVRAGKDCDLTGIAATPGTFPHQRKLEFESMEEQVEDWGYVLGRLASDFYRGDTTVAPKAYPKTCQSCSQRILCRLNPSQIFDHESTDEVDRG